MAILCLAMDLKDLERRLGNIVVGYTRDRKPVKAAKDLKADGAMTVLLKDALMPNLVQTLENNPVFIHGGPFANIAHGCNSVLATKTALKLCDYVVTEAGFGADLGAEKFFDIKCRKAGLKPSAAVIVATVRALKMHGGVAKDDLKNENVAAVDQGLRQPRAAPREHAASSACRRWSRINRFITDTDAEIAGDQEGCRRAPAPRPFLCTHWADGGKGIEALARHVVELPTAARPEFKPLYPDEMPLRDKVTTIATEIYGAERHRCRQDRAPRPLQGAADRRLRQVPGLHGQDAVLLLHRPQQKGAPSGHVGADPRSCGCPPAPSSSSPSPARS